MFSRRLRLSRLDFTAISEDRTAKRATSAHFSATVSKSGAAAGCSVVVSKKIEKSSVGRHLLKRRIRAAMRPWCTSDHALIVYARPGVNTLPFQEISIELSNLLQRIT